MLKWPDEILCLKAKGLARTHRFPPNVTWRCVGPSRGEEVPQLEGSPTLARTASAFDGGRWE